MGMSNTMKLRSEVGGGAKENREFVTENRENGGTPTPTHDYWSLTVVNLKEDLKRRGLPLKGRKAELVRYISVHSFAKFCSFSSILIHFY